MNKCVAALALLLSVNPIAAYAQDVTFGKDIWPIFEIRCLECHGPEKQEEGLRFDDLEWFTEDELTGKGDLSESLIYEMVTLDDDEDDYMPKKREHLSADEIDALRRWLEAGGNPGDWIVPTNIVVERAPSKPRKEGRVSALSKGLAPAPEDALIALRELGAVAIPVGQNNNLLRVDFELVGGEIGDVQLGLIAPLSKHITILGLSRTKVTDSGLARLQRLPNITQLNLGYTQITDASLEWIATLENLESLNIINTNVSDSGLKSLERLPHLRRVFAWRSQISRAGAEQLENMNSGVQVDLGIEISKTSE